MDRWNLGQVIGQAQDMYNRGYASANTEWDEDNFKANIVAFYAKMMDDGYRDQKSQNKSLEGFSFADLSSSWLIEEDLQPAKSKDGGFFVKTKAPIFDFTFDAMANGVHSVSRISDCDCACGDFIRISNREGWMLKRAPKTSNVYWYFLMDKVMFPGCTICVPEKVRVRYIPALTYDSEDCQLVPEPYVLPIITTVLNFMFGVKAGQPVIDTTNNQNSNTAPVTELDHNFKQNQ